MFLHELSPEQRRAVLSLARDVIDADHRLALQEVERLDRLHVEAGVPVGAGGPPPEADLAVTFGTARARMVVLLELLQIGYVDGHLHAREQEAIRRVAARLGVDAGTFHDALDWARRHHALVVEAATLGT